jgi:hypothetical protein
MTTAAVHDDADLQTTQCLICRKTGGEDAYINAIPAFVSENVEKMSLQEMAVQISRALKHDLDIDMSPTLVETHVKEHMSEKRVVMHSILTDLRQLLKTTLQHSVVTHDDTGACTIDHKACSLYLETVKQVVALYRNAGSKSEAHGASS